MGAGFFAFWSDMSDLQAHIAAEEAEMQAAAPVEPAAPVVAVEPAAPVGDVVLETPELEADSVTPDAEISEAARTLRKNRADARKAKIQGEINTSVAERNRLRDEVAELTRRATELRTPATTAPGPSARSADDPEPAESAFEDYGQFLDARARWAARDEFRKQQAAAQARAVRSESEQRQRSHAETLDAQHEAVRAKFADADTVLESFVERLRDNPRANDLAAYLVASEVGGELSYRLEKGDQDLQKRVLEAPTAAAMYRALATLEASITSPKPAAHITRAPAAPKHQVGGATTSTVDTRAGVSLKDHIRIEEAEIAQRRAAGYRY